MIEVVTENLRPKTPHRFIYIALAEHIEKYALRERLESISPGCAVVPVSAVTEGAACTVLLAEQYINNADPLMIANSDQYVDFDRAAQRQVYHFIAHLHRLFQQVGNAGSRD
jgi:hypothetical protein